MIDAKVITVCGSLKFIDKIKEETERLALEGNCVLSITYKTENNEIYTEEDLKMFQKAHFKRIEISDAIFIVNVGGYIGRHTQQEINYATSLGKEVIYMQPTNKLTLIK